MHRRCATIHTDCLWLFRLVSLHMYALEARFLDGRLVLDDHPTAACEDLFWKRTRLARSSIHVNGGEDGDRGYLPGLLVPHLMKEPDDLLSHLEYPGLDGDDIPGPQLPLVRNILLNARHPAIVLAKERGTQTDPREDMPRGLIELADIPHHVHVSHMVALPGIDGAPIGNREFDHGHRDDLMLFQELSHTHPPEPSLLRTSPIPWPPGGMS